MDKTVKFRIELETNGKKVLPRKGHGLMMKRSVNTCEKLPHKKIFEKKLSENLFRIA